MLQDVFSGRGTRGRLLRSALGVGAVQVTGMVAAFGVSVVLARALGPAGFGTYSFAMSVAVVSASVMSLGFSQFIIRELSAQRAKSLWRQARSLLRSANFLVLLAFLALGGAGLIGLLVFLPNGDRRASLMIALVLGGLLAAERLMSAGLRGFGKVGFGQIPGNVARPLFLFGATVIALSVMSTGLRPPMALVLHVLAGASSVLVASRWLAGLWPMEALETRPSFSFGRWLVPALPFLGLDVLDIMTSQVEILLLGSMGASTALGEYRVALALGLAVQFFLGASVVTLEPEVSHMFSRDEKARIQRLITTQIRWALAAALPVVLALTLLGKPILRIVFGAEYVSAYGPLVIVAIAHYVTLVFGPAAMILNMTGHEKDTIRSTGFGLATKAVLGIALIPTLQSIGAAVAYGCALIVWYGFMAIRVHRRMGLRSVPWPSAGDR